MKHENIIKNSAFFVSGFLLCSVINHFVEKDISQKREVFTEYVYFAENKEDNECNPQMIYEYCVKCKIKYPDIVVSQMMLETGFLTSNNFKKRNNLCGMKCSSNRLTTNNSKTGYAKYNSWKESVIDYGILQYLYSDTSSEENYFKWLSNRYAEDKYYIQKVKKIRLKLKKEYDWK